MCIKFDKQYCNTFVRVFKNFNDVEHSDAKKNGVFFCNEKFLDDIIFHENKGSEGHLVPKISNLGGNRNF